MRFIVAILNQFGFHPTWINWIRTCVTTVSYSLLINDQPTSFIRPTRGLRQGDPLSPYLFLLCIEILARRLTLMAYDKKSRLGVKPSPHGPLILALFFLQMIVYYFVRSLVLLVVS